MDIQRISVIDNAAVDHSKKIEKLQESHNTREVETDKESLKLKEDRQVIAQENELAFSTMRYGYNSASADLVVKITNADGSVGQYPTDSMMKLKALLKEEFVTN